MSNGTQKGVPMDNKCEVKEEFLRVDDALGALESQQDTIGRMANEICYRLVGSLPNDETGCEANGYEQRLQRLLRNNDEIIGRLGRFLERF